jgi:hypothetical protein
MRMRTWWGPGVGLGRVALVKERGDALVALGFLGGRIQASFVVGMDILERRVA